MKCLALVQNIVMTTIIMKEFKEVKDDKHARTLMFDFIQSLDYPAKVVRYKIVDKEFKDVI